MPTNKPRFSITMDDELLEIVNDYQHEQKLPTQTKAIVELIQKGVKSLQLPELENFNLEISDTDPQIDRVLRLAQRLNANGLSKLGDYAEDLAGNPAYKKKNRP